MSHGIRKANLSSEFFIIDQTFAPTFLNYI